MALATPQHDQATRQFTHVLKGKTLAGTEAGVSTADLNSLVWPRSEPGPAFDLPIAEIIDFLSATGRALEDPGNQHVGHAIDAMAALGSMPKPVLQAAYGGLAFHFQRHRLEFQVDQEIGVKRLDGWMAVPTPDGKKARVRAFPPRAVHVLAGNAPGVASMSIARAALTKGVHLFKLPSNDRFSAPAILQTMADIDSSHPVTRSLSAAYWKGGDESIEAALYRPQFFDKLVAWGGEASIRHVLRYVGPGLELVSFDPKVSISLIGREIFGSEARLLEAAVRGAADATIMNGEACSASRFQYVEGTTEQVDAYCEALSRELVVDRPLASGNMALSVEDREEIETLRDMAPDYGVFGRTDGTGVVIRSDERIDFHPTGKTVNVIPVASLREAASEANVATQTVGIYPGSRKRGLRDALASQGVQRIVTLGDAAGMVLGLPQDALYPIHRLMRWITDEGEDE